VCGLLFGICGQAQAAPIKIGCVDMQRIIKESIAGEEKSRQGTEMAQKKREEMNRLEDEINSMFNDYKKKEMVLSPEAKKEIKDNIEKRMIEKERFEKDSYRELRKFEKEAISEIVSEARKIIRQIGEQEGFTLILDSTELEKGGKDVPLSNILYAMPELDITDKVIELYDKQYRAAKGEK
jgi:outer membrane protein